MAQVHGEARLELDPDSKFAIERAVPLENSIIWRWLVRYYEEMAADAWSTNQVPLFISSNARLCRDYATLVFEYMKDFYATHPQENGPIYMLELGAGHGRFTYLFTRFLLKYKPVMEALGFPKQPFVVVFTDVALGNVTTCMKHERMQQYIEEGWIDFAHLNAEKMPEAIHLICRKENIPPGSPLVVIGNYVLDSLLTDAVQIHPAGDDRPSVVAGARVSIFSDQIEEDPEKPEVLGRATFSWDWTPYTGDNLPGGSWEAAPLKIEESSPFLYTPPTLQVEDLLEEDLNSRRDLKEQLLRGWDGNLERLLPASPPPQYMWEEPAFFDVLRWYVKDATACSCPLSVTLPVGAMRIIKSLKELSGNKLFAIFGDKGYASTSSFFGLRPPHIAIHGTVSFGCNFHALERYAQVLGGFYFSSPYKSTFNVTCLCFHDSRSSFPSLAAMMIQRWPDLLPENLVALMNEAGEMERLKKNVSLRHMNAIIRTSCHDPDALTNFGPSKMSNCQPPEMCPTYENDLLIDLAEVYANWFRIKADDDLPEIIAHMCLRVGRPQAALKYFQEFMRCCPTLVTAGTYTNLAGCYKAVGDLEAARTAVQECLARWPGFPAAVTLDGHLEMTKSPQKVALVGCGPMVQDMAYFLAKEDRMRVVAIFDLNPKVAHDLRRGHKFKDAVILTSLGALSSLEKDVDILLDLDRKIWPVLLPQLWSEGRFLLSEKSFGLRPEEVANLITQFNERNRERRSQQQPALVWHIYDRDAVDRFPEPSRLAPIGRILTVSVGSRVFRREMSANLEIGLRRETLRLFDIVRLFTNAELVQIGARRNEKTSSLSGLAKWQTSDDNQFTMTFHIGVAEHGGGRIRGLFIGTEGRATFQCITSFWSMNVQTNHSAVDSKVSQCTSPNQDTLSNYLMTSFNMRGKKTASMGPDALGSIAQLVQDANIGQGLEGSLRMQGLCVGFSKAAKENTPRPSAAVASESVAVTH